MTTAHHVPHPAGPPSTGHAPGPASAVVVGGGIAGLAAAHRLLAAGARVTLLEGSERLGGKLRAGEVGGVPVDLGAESLLARRPEAVGLARAVGLGDRIQPPTSASAGLWCRGALRPMPKGHVMGVPADPAPLAAAGVLSAEGLARIEEDARLPRTPVGEDVAVGAYVAQRLGREVVDRLVEPLLGGVYAGDAYQISLRAAVPQLFEQARTHRSLMEGVREVQRRAAEAPRPDGPVFAGIDGGIGTLPGAVADALLAGGADLRLRTRATALRRTPDGWRITVDSPRGPAELRADAVVLAVPADAAAGLLAHDVPAAAAELATVAYASMALVTLAFRRADLPGALTGGGSSGFLVPPVEGRHIKASTFSSNKWGWVGAADPGTFVLRTSLGRHGDTADLDRDDADLVRLSLEDLREAVGIAARPVDSRVVRWHDGLPQYPVGHLDRVARVQDAVAAHPGLALCGAAYEGVGIPACVASASRAAGQVLRTLAQGAPSEE